ncbi:MAG: ATP synthase F0 subunit C [Clostridia bacterium]|nr:ATP synthase F0 subunit C [Clostridia bacterium]
MPVFASEEVPAAEAVAEEGAVEETDGGVINAKAWAAAIVVGLAAAVGAFAMGMAITKSVDGIARQPEAEGKIRTTLMLGLVFVETAIIYALVIAILIIFVL